MNYLSTQIMAHINGVFNNLTHMPACDDRKQLIDRFLECAKSLMVLRDEATETNTRLGYLYRDASNWKTWNSVVLKGVMTPEMYAEMQECCEDGLELFIPEQLGLDLVREWETTEDDHPYAELGEYELVPNKPTTDMTVEELLERFRQAKDNWCPEDYEPEVEHYDDKEDKEE